MLCSAEKDVLVTAVFHDLAELYEVTTCNLNLAVRRNRGRFPEDFMFQLTGKEAEGLILQFAISKKRKREGRGGRRTPPYAFTEHGVAMLSSVLNSERAAQMNIVIIRAFIKMREVLATQKDLARKIDDLELKYQQHDHELTAVFEAIRQLISTPAPSKRKIGFASGNS